MAAKNRGKLEAFHWVGMDVSKAFFDAAVFSQSDQEAGTALRELPVRRFCRSQQGVGEFETWLAEELGESSAAVQTRVVMEATGRYSTELAVWLLEDPCSLRSAIVNPQPVAHFIKSLALRSTTDRLAARALALYGAQRRPAPYEPPSKEEAALREMVRYRQFLVAERIAMSNQAMDGTGSAVVRRMQARRRRRSWRGAGKGL